MKTITFLALAGGLGKATATFRGAKSFNCPSNTIEICDAQQQSGFDWLDLADGFFNNYGGFDFNGFECKSDGFGKRDSLTGRTFGSKAIWGSADRNGGSSFGCGSNQIDRFSIATFDISVDVDIDLEFHYDMADGSKCKQRSRCSKDGTTINNSQCGGAKNVTVVVPEQDNNPSPSCSFGFHSISFFCGTPTATTADSTVASTSTSAVEVSTTPVDVTSTEAIGSTITDASSSEVISTISSEVVETSVSEIVDTTITSDIVETSASEISDTTTTSEIVETSASEIVETSSTEVIGTTEVETLTESSTHITTFVTTSLSTSTVFETSLITITSCAPTIPDCPAEELSTNSVVVVTQTVAVSTTLCPVTETMTTIIETPVSELTSNSPEQTTSVEVINSSITHIDSTTQVSIPSDVVSTSEVVSTTSTGAVETITETTDLPVETLPCPGVVPSCLNTWMFTVDCSDNTDASCYCPDEAFVENIFSCIYSYSESDEIVQEAVEFFQGICAGHADENPAIITGAETVTTVITVTPTPIPSAIYTTVEVIKTTVVPCEENGTTIPFSSSTVTVSTQVTVPQVTFQTTAEPGQTTSDVILVPGTTTAIAISETAPVLSETTTFYTQSNSSMPSGTGILPTGTTTSIPIFTGAAAPRGVSFGAAVLGVAGAMFAL